MKGRKDNKRRIILGITGSFGSGKTTVAGMFKSFGARIIDADRIARQLTRPKLKIYKKIIDTFGRDILKKDKTVDRNKLAHIVFENKNLLKRLNRILHPEIISIIEERIRSSRTKIIVLDAPLLIEAGMAGLVDKLVVVKITRKKQIKRIQGKASLSKKEILERIKSQIPLQVKVALADFVIDNSGTVNNTEIQVIKIWKKLQPRKHGNKN